MWTWWCALRFHYRRFIHKENKTIPDYEDRTQWNKLYVMKSCALSCLTVLFHYYSNISSAPYLLLIHLICTGRVYWHWHHLLWAARNERFLQVSATISMCFLFLEHCIFCLYIRFYTKKYTLTNGTLGTQVSLLKTSCHAFHHSRWGSDNWIKGKS